MEHKRLSLSAPGHTRTKTVKKREKLKLETKRKKKGGTMVADPVP
jgi:hypothetical protein